jgi:hypothetical protein
MKNRNGKGTTTVVKFTVKDLHARLTEAFSVQWQGKELDPGPLEIELDSTADTHNAGVLDYTARRAQAEFHVLLSFPEFASTMEGLGVDPELTRPVHAVIRSEGAILDDHSFVLSGPCELARHELLNSEETRASVLAGT